MWTLYVVTRESLYKIVIQVELDKDAWLWSAQLHIEHTRENWTEMRPSVNRDVSNALKEFFTIAVHSNFWPTDIEEGSAEMPHGM